ncbi:MAG: hypothetical protein ACW963_07880 [Candidatus Sifarchaeia archaeon]|jgi:hypothetical protein
MVKKWVSVSDMGGDPWVLPIWSALDEGVEKGKFSPKTQEMTELAIHLSTRLDMIPWIVKRLNTDWEKLKDKITDIGQKYVSSEDRHGYAYKLDDEITYNLLIDIDTFLFEIDSCCELITAFIGQIYNHIGIQISKNKFGTELKKIIEKEGKDTGWFEALQRHRNLFIHEAAPYIAIDFTEADKGSYDLIIMKENLKTFKDEDKFIRLLEEFDYISKGFTESKEVLKRHVVNLLSA